MSSNSTADGATVLQYTCSGATNQQWQVRDVGSGYADLVARHSGKCAQVNSASTADGTGIVQRTCGTGHQPAVATPRRVAAYLGDFARTCPKGQTRAAGVRRPHTSSIMDMRPPLPPPGAPSQSEVTP